MTDNLVKKSADKAHAIDDETQRLMASVRKKNNTAVVAFIVCWSILLGIGIVGIFRQNKIATENKNHIDCIVKLLATPIPPGAKGRVLANPSTTCNINFTQ